VVSRVSSSRYAFAAGQRSPVSALDAPGRCDLGDVWADPIRPDLTEGEAVATIGQIFRNSFTCGDLAPGALHPGELTSETTSDNRT
jgi:hypothetical protein